MNLQPLEDRIVVRPAEAEETTHSGLVIPDTAKEKPQQGEVLAIGPGRRAENSGELIPIDLTVGDGLALISSVHTLKFSSLTYSNRVTGDPLFSKGGLEAAELLTTTDILSNFGEKRVLDFNRIVTGNNPTVVNAVKQFLRSTTDNTQNNPGVVNTHQNAYEHVILTQLATTATGAIDATKKNWWFLVAANAGLRGWQAYFVEWEPMNLIPSTSGNGTDVHKDIWYFNVRQSYNIGVVSGRGLIASCPTN